ncbi:MAG TPA: hypothetical protein VFY10_04225, partial [Dehalococcoidia bacterium]|nr:hypothetical protein [Dehalococcoidia bacterium]
FYTETTPRFGLEAKCTELQHMVQEFKGNLPSSVRFRLDFLFDPERQFLFEASGALRDSNVSHAVDSDVSIRETAHWLRHAGGTPNSEKSEEGGAGKRLGR